MSLPVPWRHFLSRDFRSRDFRWRHIRWLHQFESDVSGSEVTGSEVTGNQGTGSDVINPWWRFTATVHSTKRRLITIIDIELRIFNYHLSTNSKSTLCNLTLYAHTSQFVWQYLMQLWNTKLLILCFIVFIQHFMVSQPPSFQYRENKRSMKI